MPFKDKVYSDLSKKLIEGMLKNMEANSQRAEEIDQEDYEKSTRVEAPQVGESRLKNREEAPEAPNLPESGEA